MAKFNFRKKANKNKKSIQRRITSFERIDELKNDTKKLNKWFDKLFTNKKYLRITSLVLAILFVGSFYASTGIFSQNESSKVVNDVPVVVKYDSEQYVVDGTPSTATISIVGPEYAIEQTLSNPDFQLVIDLTNALPGEKTVPIEVVGAENNVQVNVEPNFVKVNVQKKATEVFPVTVTYSNMDSLDTELSLTSPVLSTNEVEVTGSQSEINKIASVQAIVDVSGVTNKLEQEATVYAYDEYGNKLNVKCNPSTINVSAEVKKTYKEVTVNPIINGTPANDMAVASATASPATVTIYGSEEVLKDITSVDVVVDVNKAKSSFTEEVELVLPNGVRKVEPQTVTVDVKLDQKKTATIPGVPIEFKNLGENLTAQVTEEKYATIDIQVTGAASVVDNLTKDDITAFVDLKGLTKGTYTMQVQLSPIDNVELQIDPKEGDLLKKNEIEIKIS